MMLWDKLSKRSAISVDVIRIRNMVYTRIIWLEAYRGFSYSFYISSPMEIDLQQFPKQIANNANSIDINLQK